MWKLETTAKGYFVYVSLLRQQGNNDFEFISVIFWPFWLQCVTNAPEGSLFWP